jgi:hypothetical protein
MTQEAKDLAAIIKELKAQSVPEEAQEAARVLFVFGWPTPKIMRALARSTSGTGITPIENKPLQSLEDMD